MLTPADPVFEQCVRAVRQAAALCRASTDLVARTSATRNTIRQARQTSPARVQQRLAAGSSDAVLPMSEDQGPSRAEAFESRCESEALSRAALATLVDCSDDAIVSKTL